MFRFASGPGATVEEPVFVCAGRRIRTWSDASVCVCVCVCVRERERERERGGGRKRLRAERRKANERLRDSSKDREI